MLANMSFFLVIITCSFLLFSARFAATNSSDKFYEVGSAIRVYRNGTVERIIGTHSVPPSFDPTVGVQSKDVDIAPTLNISARLYLPINAAPTSKLPLLVYFHGGAFCAESPFTPLYHNHLNSIVGKANVVAVSVNYRLAPEHPLPIAYQDCWLALKWVFSHRKANGNGTEAWLTKYVDFDRVYLGGDSAGGNIAHNTAIRIGSERTKEITLHGMFLNCPHFWGTNPIGKEASEPEREAWVERIWTYAYPNSTGFDDPLSNPAMDPNLSKLGCKEVVVYAAQLDIFRDREWYYEESLKKSEWDGVVNVVETKGEDHVFNVKNPNSPKANRILNHLNLFLNHKLGSHLLG